MLLLSYEKLFARLDHYFSISLQFFSQVSQTKHPAKYYSLPIDVQNPQNHFKMSKLEFLVDLPIHNFWLFTAVDA